jgi:Carbohydrate esterase, sialic acid-specific acetylesterase
MKKQFEKRTNPMRFLTVTMAVSAMLMAATPVVAGKPLKIIILAGQSNMQKPCSWQTLKGLADSPETKPLYDKLVDENGKVRVFSDIREAIVDETTTDENGKTVPVPGYGAPVPHKFGGLPLISEKTDTDEKDGRKGGKKGGKKGDGAIGGNFGPELGFSMALYEDLKEPVLIIKTAWGGKSLNLDFRPPTGTEWIPPKGHPDNAESGVAPLPIPTSFTLPDDFQPPTGRGKNFQIFLGVPMGEMNGLYPIYVLNGYGEREELKSIPLEKGDLILGLNGEGLHEDPVTQWRDTWFNKTQKKGNWKLSITLLRSGIIKTVTVDTSEALKGGSDAADEYVAEKAAARKKLLEEGGEYYQMMIQRIKDVLADPGKYHPAYDPKQGYEIAGFVWFHGYNDIISSVTYPNGSKPRGFEQYSWLLAQLIRSVRKEVNAPKMPVVIGVFGQGGDSDRGVQFREAQAAVADYDEFKGSVVAVPTIGFLDPRIEEIKNKLDRVMAYEGNDPNHEYAKLKAKVVAYKEERLAAASKLEGRARAQVEGSMKKGLSTLILTEEEKEYMKNNVSNQGYHYNGSPKFFVRAGEAFAKALSGLIKK